MFKSRSDWFLPHDSDDSFTIKIEGSMIGNNFHRFIKNGHIYYAIPHNSPYKVKMTNNSNHRANATLKIDGDTMGVWRLEAYSDITVERPTNNNRKFTFVRETSWQADMGGVARGSSQNGLVEVIFVPEIKNTFPTDFDHDINYNNMPEFNTRLSNQLFSRKESQGFQKQSNQINESMGLSDSMNFTNSSYGVGGTVLGGSSSQRFSSASAIIEDHSRKQTKRIRLVVPENDQPFVSIRSRGWIGVEDEIRDDPIPPQLGRYPKKSKFVYNDHDSDYQFADYHSSEEYARPKSNLHLTNSRNFYHDDSFGGYNNFGKINNTNFNTNFNDSYYS